MPNRERVRTLLFSTLYPSAARAGHGIFVETRLRKLLETAQVEARVVAPVPWFPSTNPRFGTYAAYARTPAAETRHGIEVVHPRYFLPPRVGMTLAPLLLALGAWPSVRRLLKSGYDFDVIDAHYMYPDGVAAALIARWCGKPFVVTARGTDINVIGKFRLPAAWMRWAARRASATIAVSAALAERMAADGLAGSVSRVLRNGIDGEAFAPVDKHEARRELGLQGGPVLLTVGNLLPAKRQAIAIDALRELLPAQPGAWLLIVGDGPLRASLAQHATRAGVAERVRFEGAVAQQRLPTYYSAADAMLLPSEREGWPNVVLESLACGTPVLAARVGGVPEILVHPDLGEVIEVPEGAAYAHALRRVLGRAVERSSLRGRALAMGWGPVSDAQLELFRAAAA